MSALRYIIPVVAAAAGAAAQCSGTTTISSAADATALAMGCGSRTYSGDIVIATGVTDPIALDTITGISGSLIAKNVKSMPALSADSIQSIGKTFDLEALTMLTSLSFPKLTSVQDIMFTNLVLQGLSFDTGVTMAQSVTITDTKLMSLEGINLMQAQTISIQNNLRLTSVDMPLTHVADSLLLASNGQPLDAQFSDLTLAGSLVLRNVSTVSIPSLKSVNTSLGFYSGGFSSLAAPNLTDVGGDLSINYCDSLTNISMPELTTIGGAFQIANNTNLESIDGFPKVETVGGAVDFPGVFKTVELPALSDVVGAFNIQSTENITAVCNHFESLTNNGPIEGVFTCEGNDDTPGGLGSLPDGTSSGSGGTTSSGAAHPLLIPGATGLLGVFAAIFGLL